MPYEISYLKNPELLQPGDIVIEDPSGLTYGGAVIETTRLTSGKIIQHPQYLKGGGQVYKNYFLQILKDKKYINAFEWCAGHGEIGFELITNGICETLTFSDCYDKSAEWCLKNAEELGLKEQVFAYTTPQIANIPTKHKWDLVVGNPPNGMGMDYTQLEVYRSHNISEDHYRLYLRTTLDIGYHTHQEFFQNIKQFITDNADIFITAHIAQKSELEKITILNGFKIVEIFDMYPDDPGLKIFHYKAI